MADRSPHATKRWRFLRWLLPKRFAARYADDILQTHIDAAAAAGTNHGLRFWMAVMVDLLSTAWQVRVDSAQRRLPILAARGARYTIDAARQDTRYATRQLVRAPIFTLVAAMSLAVGIGVCVGAMNVVYAIFYQPLPISAPDDLYHIYTSHPNDRYRRNTFANYTDFKRAGAFSELSAVVESGAVLSGEGLNPSQAGLEMVTPDYFRMLGIRPTRGRWLTETEDGEPRQEIVVTYDYWQRELGGSAVLGRTIRANGVDLSIIGIGPPGFHGTRRSDNAIAGWVPVSIHGLLYRGGGNFMTTRRWGNVDVLGRLATGVTQEAAQSRMDAVASSLAAAHPKEWKYEGRPLSITVLDERESRTKPQRGEKLAALGVFSLLVAIILVIACVNVAGLMMARAVARQHEIAVRLTLGAGKGRLFAQLFWESLLLALAGGVLGALATHWVLEIVNTYPAAAALRIRSSWRLLGFALIASTVSAFIFGMMPALQSLRADVRAGLSSTHTAGADATRARGRILAVQVAASCFLLVVAFAVLQGYRNQLRTDPGFETRGVITGTLRLTAFGGDTSAAARYIGDVRSVLGRTPVVQDAGFTTYAPYDDGRIPMSALQPMPNGELAAYWQSTAVDPAYFDVLDLKLLRGRGFNAGDTVAAEPVVIVNETFARGFGAVVGEFTDGGQVRARVIGIVRNTVYFRANEPQQPFVYYPLAAKRAVPYTLSFVARVPKGMERAAAEDVRRAIVDVYPEAEPPRVLSMDDHIEQSAASQRVIANAALGIGGIELALAAVGLYGILLYTVLARRRELGVRLALGAGRRTACWAVLRQSLVSAAWGLAAGLLCSIPVLVILAKGWFGMVGVTLTAPLPYLAALVTACGAVVIASWIPARRASSINPAAALRYD